VSLLWREIPTLSFYASVGVVGLGGWESWVAIKVKSEVGKYY